jgi:hypothetical protein
MGVEQNQFFTKDFQGLAGSSQFQPSGNGGRYKLKDALAFEKANANAFNAAFNHDLQ